MQVLFNPMVATEVLLLIGALLLAFARPASANSVAAILDRVARMLPTSTAGQMMLVAALAVVPRMLLLPWLGAPTPIIHDEHSLLLQAETFLQGLLALPPHPLGAHFESFHVNQWPTHASIYFPGRSFPLVVGLGIFGHPWPGVWLSFVALACATVWMLRAWVRPTWALLGGILVVFRLGLFSYWINSYWGGTFTALGAMLVVGALPRILERPQWRDGLLLGLGVLVMMTSRPFEGLLLCLAMGLALLPKTWRAGWPWLRQASVKAALPLVGCVAFGVVLLGAYNQATTGDPLTTPYEVNRQAYAVAPAFLFQDKIEGDDRYAGKPLHFQLFYQDEAMPYVAARSGPAGMVASIVGKARALWAFYIGIALTIPFLLGLWALRRDWIVPFSLAIVFAGFASTVWALAHYVAPAMPLILIVIMRGFQQLASWQPHGRPTGPLLARLLPIAAMAPALVVALGVTTGVPKPRQNSWSRCCAIRTTNFRSELSARLAIIPGRKLVLVESGRFRPRHQELVYNGARIDDAPIVWAHSLAPAQNRRLIAHFGGRQVWRLRWTGVGTVELQPLLRDGEARDQR